MINLSIFKPKFFVNFFMFFLDKKKLFVQNTCKIIFALNIFTSRSQTTDTLQKQNKSFFCLQNIKKNKSALVRVTTSSNVVLV